LNVWKGRYTNDDDDDDDYYYYYYIIIIIIIIKSYNNFISYNILKKVNYSAKLFTTKGSIIGRSEVAQGTGASFKFQVIDNLTPPHERTR